MDDSRREATGGDSGVACKRTLPRYGAAGKDRGAEVRWPYRKL